MCEMRGTAGAWGTTTPDMDDDGDGNADGVDVVMTMVTMLKGGDGDDAEIVLVPCVRRLVGDRCPYVPSL